MLFGNLEERYSSSLNATNSSAQLSSGAINSQLTVVVSCGVVGRDGAVDLQVQGRRHSGLLTADLWPRPEWTDCWCQVTSLWVCFFLAFSSPLHSLLSFSFLVCPFIVLSFILIFFKVCLCLCMSNNQFLIRCVRKPKKIALEIVSKSLVFVKPS